MSLSACMQVRPTIKLPENLNTPTNNPMITLPRRRKDKAIIVIGATGTGKSRLSIDIATRYGGEVINSDKIQVYKGLDIISNKITDGERRHVPHHLLDVVDPDEDFTAEDYIHHASAAAESITKRGRLPIITGGSVSFVKALVADRVNTCEFSFLWMDASMHVLGPVLSKRVDVMVERGLVEEAREFYAPDGDYSRGIRRAIGVPEMDKFFRSECGVDDGSRSELLQEAIDEIKDNSCKLACYQVEKILRLSEDLGVEMLRLDATAVLEKSGVGGAVEWRKAVVEPSTRVLSCFV